MPNPFMWNLLLKSLLLGAVLFFFTETTIAQNRYWISASSSNWNNSANWSANSGGAGGASVPNEGNVAVFDGAGGGNGTCNLDIAPTVGGVTMNGYSGTVDLNGFTLTSTGTHTFTTGTISNTGTAASLALNTTGTSTFSGTTFNADLTGTSGRFFFNGSTFNGTVSVTKTANNTDNGTGGNTFNGSVTFINSSTSPLQLAGTNPDIFQGELTLTINSTGEISLASVAAGNLFNNNIFVNYDALGVVRFGQTGGTSTLASTRTISISGIGASGCGSLQLANFTQVGTTTPQSIILSGNNTATLTIGPATTFNSALTVTAPRLGLQTSTFNGVTQLTKTGTNADNLRGGNLFVGTTTIINQGADLIFGSNPADAGDTFNGTTTFDNLGGNRIRVSEETAGTVFNGDAVFNCLGTTDAANRIQISRLAGAETTFNGSATFVSNGTNSDIHISYDAGSSTTFNGPVYFTSSAIGGGDFYVGVDGNVAFTNNVEFNNTVGDVIYVSQSDGTVSFGNGIMTIGPGGFSQGQLRLRRFTQTGTSTQSLTFTGTASLHLGPASQFNGDVNFITPQIYLSGCTFNGTTYIEKNGATENTGAGSNIFNGVTTLVNSGSGNFISGNTSNDIFNNDLTLINSGTALISMAGNSAGNVFNGNIVVNSSSGNGIYFGNGNGASASLANGKTITIGGSGFSSGQLRLSRFTQNSATPQTLTLTGTALLLLGPSSQFDGDVTFITPQLLLNGTTFVRTAYLEKNGGTGNTSNGGNIYNGATTVVNSGSGTLDLANTSPDVFNRTLLVNNTGSYRIQIGINSAGNLFNGDVTINQGGTANVSTVVARNSGSTATFNGNLNLNCTNTGGNGSGLLIALDGTATINGNVLVSSTNEHGILFGSGLGTVTLENGYTIKENGADSFTKGTLSLKAFTQVGTTAQNITLSGTANLTLGPSSSFWGDVNFISPQISLNGCTFDGTTYIEKNGATANTGSGNNIFNGVTTLVNSGSGNFISGNPSNDVFNNDLTLTNTGSASIRMADNSAGNIFGGNISVNSTSGTGIYFGDNAAASASLATGKTIATGSSGFTSGELRLKRFTQIGATAQTLTLAGSALLRIGPSSQFNGDVNFVAPSLAPDGCTYNGTTVLEKNGSTNDVSSGNNIFNGTTTLLNSGSGYLLNANSNLDTFNGQLTLTNTGTSIIYMAYNVPGTLFNDNIIVNSTAGGSVIFGNNSTGSSTLAAGKTITVGGLGFNGGDLRLQRFTQVGGTNQNLILTGNALLRLGPTTQFDGDVNFVAPQILLHGATYNGTAYIEKNGATSNSGTGGNTFNGTTSIVNSGSGQMYSATSNPDTFNGQLTLTNTGTSVIYMAHAVTGTTFNGNVVVNSVGSGGIYFANDTRGDATLGSGLTLSVGATGFSSGELRLRRFTQSGTTAQNITLTGTAVIRVGPTTTFNGAVNFTAPQVYLDGATFASTATIVKNGAGNNDGAGGNSFNGITTITNSSANRLLLAITSADTYNADVTFVRSGAGAFDVAYAQANGFAGNITVNSAGGITFGRGGGTVLINGSGAQSLSKMAGSASPSMPRLTMAKPGNTLTLNTDLTISTNTTFTSGIINSTSSNFLLFAANTTAADANDASYVDGPVRKTGATAFTFPVGNGNFYRPITISAPSSATHQFTAQYFRSVQGFGGESTWDPDFYTVSGCEYWVLDRTIGTSNVTVTLSWNDAACDGAGYITNLTDLRVARFNSATSKWVNEGNGGASGTTSSGTIPSAASVTTFSPFTLASVTSDNPLPIELGSFWATDEDGLVKLNWITYSENNNEKFSIQRSPTGFDFETLSQIPGAGDSNQKITYTFLDEAPLDGRSYYRLKQTDFDGTESYSEVITVLREGSGLAFQLYPNPAGNELIHFNQKANITIVNSMGQLIMTAQEVEEIDVSKLAAGVYIIKTQKDEVLRFVRE